MMRRGSVKGAYAKPRKGTLLRLTKFVMKEHKWRVIYVVSAMMVAIALNISATSIIQNIVKEALLMIEHSSTDFSGVIKQTLIMASLQLANIIITYTHLRVMIKVGQESLLRLREMMFTHMTKLPLKYFDTHQHGELMSLFTNDVDATRQMISQSMPQLFVSIFSLLGYLTAMFIVSYVLTLIMLVMVSLLLFVAKKITSTTRRLFKGQQEALGKVNGFIEEMIEGQKVIKVFRHEQKALADFEVLNHNLFKQSEKAGKRIGILIPFTINMGYLAYVIVAVVGVYLITINWLFTPQLIFFLVLTRSFTGPINQISNQMNFVGLASAGADRIFRLTEQDVEIDQGAHRLTYATYKDGSLVESDEFSGMWAWKNPENGFLIKLCGDVRFKDVTFGYNEKPVLKNVSLYAKPGQKIAFVGATGAGKTTIANLINRFYDINEGEITFDGINIKDIKKSDLRNALAVVLQDTNLFTTSVKENIRYGNLLATDQDIIKAAKSANAHEFILKLPEGYETILTNNGENLSQGQRQLLSIARAVVANPPVLILDEATSSVDTHTEKLIQDGMDKLMKGRTVFVIAHRLSTIQNSNAIIVLEQGEIIERGSHDVLIDNQGKYYQLYTGAFELE